MIIRQEPDASSYSIFAQSSGVGKAGVIVFRISGKNSMRIIQQLMLCNNYVTFKPSMMYCKKIYNPCTKELIDQALVVYFKAPYSFTGEDVVEIHTHGSIAISKVLTQVLLNTKLARLAEPGEFTKRAFLNCKFDLTAAEAIADLINAETQMQHRQAINQMQGSLERLYSSWRKQLLQIISLLEAYIDFPEEEIPQMVLNQAQQTVNELKEEINKHLDDKNKGEILRDGIKLAIIGEPNVGKSSLINFLTKRDIAITSDIAGTTRDIIEAYVDIGGYPIAIQDTAGLRSGNIDSIEDEGIKRAINAASNAHIKIIMLDTTSILTSEILQLIDDNSLVVINKIDIDKIKDDKIKELDFIPISLKDDIGLDVLIEKITNMTERIAGLTDVPHITRQRHRDQISDALEHLKRFDIDKELVLAIEDIRLGISAMNIITGKITVDEILGEIFDNFCIGK